MGIEFDEWDFGFTAVSEEELQSVQTANENIEKVSVEAELYKSKLIGLHKAITPFLNNLKKNPEKDYIYWKDRVPKIEEFQKHLETFLK